MTYGISGLKLYVPPYRVDLEAWCRWTDAPWEKIRAVVGESFRLPGPEESIYTMAASAVLALIRDYDVDPKSIGFLGFGTESSTDNSAGAVIIKGLVDRGLEAMGLERLPRNCEVPEHKHACLGGIYAVKNALRYLAFDGRGRVAIVVSGDIALYERGSSGEQTQGSGAVALLLEEDPQLLALDLNHAGSVSDYRGPDFRKPFRRHFASSYHQGQHREHDFPVFSGRYSTVCFIDETVRAVEVMLKKLGRTPRDYYHDLAAAFFHRPYHQMPVNAAAALYVFGLGQSDAHRSELEALCEACGTDFDAVRQEMVSEPRLFDMLERDGEPDPYPASMKVAKSFRKSPKFREVLAAKMKLGEVGMSKLGNLYTASLPAWVAMGFEEALNHDVELFERELVLIGYGSGDAAEAIPARAAENWRHAARRIGVESAMAHAVNLDREQYEALHDGRPVAKLSSARSGFRVDRVGIRNEADFQDFGIEYYRYDA